MSLAPTTSPSINGPAVRWQTLSKGILLILLTLACYAPALRGDFVFDDVAFVRDNPLLQSSQGLAKVWFSTEQPDYWPVSYTGFWLQRRCFGDETLGYHLVNWALHIAVSLMVWVVLRQLRLPGAYFAALLFALHPVNVESAAWIFQQKTTLAAALGLGSLAAWLQFQSNRRAAWLATAVALFVLAMLSKTSVVMLPCVLLTLAWWRHGRIERRDFLATTPFFAAALTIGLLALRVQRNVAIGEDFARQDGWWERLALAGWTPWFYLGKAFWPQSLAFVYPRWHADPAAVWPWLPGAAIVLLAIVAWCAKSSWGRPLLCAGGCHLLALFPVMGLIDIPYMRYSLVADHWQYLALIVPIALTAWAVAQATQVLPLSGRRLLYTGAGAVAFLLGLLTWQTAGVYRDEHSLWTDCLAKNPTAWVAYNNLGRVYVGRGEEAKTESCYRAALALDPTNVDIRQNLAWSLLRQHKTTEALQLFQEARDQRPDRSRLHFGMGCALIQAHRDAEAESSLAAAIELGHPGSDAFEQLGGVLRRLERRFAAEECYRRALKIDPKSAGASLGLAMLFVDRGDFAAAESLFSSLVSDHPTNAPARLHFANLRAAQGRTAEAIDMLRTAVTALPNSAELHAALGERLTGQGQEGEALSHLERAAALNPLLPHAHAALAVHYAKAGQTTAAIDCYRTALRLEPELHEARRALADLLAVEGDVVGAIVEYRTALAGNSNWPAASANLAYLLMSQPGAGPEEAAEALRWAHDACRQTADKHPVALDTLAAAYAALGRFDEAAVAEEKARDRARAANQAEFALQAERRLLEYQARRLKTIAPDRR